MRRIAVAVVAAMSLGLLGPAGAQASGWQVVYDRPSNTISEIEMADDEVGLALTGPGVLRTVDGGLTWTEPEDKPFVASGQVGFASRDVAWVVTLSGGIWRTDDAGETWERQASGITAHFNSIAVIDEEEAWAAASGEGFSDVGPIEAPPSALLHTTDGGATWRAEQVPGFGTFEQVAAADGLVWVVATRCQPGTPFFPEPPTDTTRVLITPGRS